MMLPLLAFVFGTALVAAAAYALHAVPRRRDRSPARRADDRAASRDEEKPRFQALVGRDEAGRREGAALAEGARLACGCAWCRPATAATRR